jgi:hypothetical protein
MSKITDGTLADTARAMLLVFGMHAAHEAQMPPFRRQEHVPENEPVLAGDLGINWVTAAATTSGAQFTINPLIGMQFTQPS